MTSRKAFFITFFISLSIMMGAYGLLYLSLTYNTSPAGTPQQGVPIARPSVNDSKTILMEAGDEQKFYFLLKFNRIQSKISILSISPDYVYQSTGRSLEQSAARAGIMQCVLDTKQEFGINIDYYLSLSWDQAGRITKNFTDFGLRELGENLPATVKNYLLKNAEKLDTRSLVNMLKKAETFLDNDLGLAFLNETAYLLLFHNGRELYSLTSQQFRNSYSSLSTNINTENLKGFERILTFLDPTVTTYYRNVITAHDTDAHSKVSRAILE